MYLCKNEMASTTSAARKHVEKIRKTKFSIGGKSNPLTEDLHQAVKNLSAELYAKDVHFLMELIQVFSIASLSFVVFNSFFLLIFKVESGVHTYGCFHYAFDVSGLIFLHVNI